MADRGSVAVGFAPNHRAADAVKKNATEVGLLTELESLWASARGAFAQERTWRRAQAMSLSALVCLGRHTVTGLLTTGGSQFQDWSAAYRLFSQERIDLPEIFATIRRAVIDTLAPSAPLVVAMDDSLIRKTGRKIPGVAWRRDPLSPPFQVNLVRGQRILQLSAAIPVGAGSTPARMVPIDFRHTPTAQRCTRDVGYLPPTGKRAEYEQTGCAVSTRSAPATRC